MKKAMTPKQAIKYYANILAEVRKAKDLTVKVGVLNGQDQYKDGTTLGEVAAAHEYGIGTARRSFLRMPFAVKSKEMEQAIFEQYENILSGRIKAIKAIGFVGVEATEIVKDAFLTQGYGVWKPLSAKTIESKGSSQTLIDTGKLRQSISWEVK